jgi:hypothetical protein
LYVMSSKEVRMHEQKRKIVGHNIYWLACNKDMI